MILTRIKQVISNSLQHTGDKSGEIKMYLTNGIAGLRIIIQNNGIGIRNMVSCSKGFIMLILHVREGMGIFWALSCLLRK